MQLKPYLIVPKLIPQPTWGGGYIANYKGIQNASILGMKIGQSYELCEETMLTAEEDPKKIPLEIADPKTGKTIEVIGDSSTMFPLQTLIDQNPEAVLGKEYLEKFGAKMQILIKFTQAKGNSFQVHVRPERELGHWKPKPESWYYFEKGRATLGLKPDVDIEEYRKICKEIETFMKRQEQRVKSKKVSVDVCKKEIHDFLESHDPFQFVNVVDVPKGAIIDLSFGGVHHSWEEGEDIPDGNILYEVQLNVMDDDCTLRSFDKGKIGDDGSIRPIHVDDYFSALDTNPAHSDLKTLVGKPRGDMLFDSPYYKSVMNVRENSIDTTFDSNGAFVHRFFMGEGAKKGKSVFTPKICQ